jgi:hypothetical protein
MSNKQSIPASKGPGFGTPNTGKSATIPTPLFKPVAPHTRKSKG